MRINTIICIAAVLLAAVEANGQTKSPSAKQQALPPLDRLVTLEAVDKPLDQALRLISAQTGVKIELHADKLAEQGADVSAMKISCHFRRCPLRTTLWLLLYDSRLTYEWKKGQVHVGTVERAVPPITLETYDVGNLLPLHGKGPITREDYRELIRIIEWTCSPDSWRRAGGDGSIHGARGRLFVTQTEPEHREVATLIEQLRVARQSGLQSLTSSPKLTAITLNRPGYVQLKKKLSQKATLRIKRMPVEEFAAIMSKRLDVSILVDWNALADVGLSRNNAFVAGNFEDLAIDEAIEKLLEGISGQLAVGDHHLLFSAASKGHPYVTARVYPIADLLGEPTADAGLDDRKRDFDVDDLMDLIKGTSEYESWEDAGGEGSVEPLSNWGLLVQHQYQVHEQIEATLAKLREDLKDAPGKTAKALPPARDRLETVVYLFDTPQAAASRQQLLLKQNATRAPPKKDSRKTPSKPSTPPAPQPKTNQPLKPPTNPFDGEDPFRDLPRSGTPKKPPKTTAGTDVPRISVVAAQLTSQPGQTQILQLERPIAEEDLLKLVKRLIAADSWEGKGIVIEAAEGRLVVRHKRSVHEQISKLATRLKIKDFREIRKDNLVGFGGGGGFF